MSPLADVEAGQELDHYHIDDPVSSTGMATIFRATDTRDGRAVAIKIPHPSVEMDPVAFDRFKREEEIGITLNHPNVMSVYPDGHRSRLYMVMEWCEGRLLRSILSEEGKLPPERAIKITLGILGALEYIHQHGVIHRDLKPENIMVDEHDEIKLIDFGIASKEGAKRLTYTGYTQILGTPEYISPEQVKGKRGDARSDLYSVGVMLYEMLTGKTPFSGPSPLAVMNDRLINHPVPPRTAASGISPELQEVLYRALERDPRNRYPTARAFAWDLEHLDQVGVAERAELKRWKNRRGMSSRKILLYSVVGLIPILLFLLMLLLARHHG
jgi:serine/threonine-protein kinase